MWPWSTIRSLRQELAQAEKGNATLRGMITHRENEAESYRGEMHRRSAEIERLRKEFGADREVATAERERLTAMLGESRRRVVSLDDVILGKNRALAAQTEVSKALAAERDEAVLRAWNVDAQWAACQNKLAEAHIALRGAMVRDPATGRMTRWVDPSQQELEAVSGRLA